MSKEYLSIWTIDFLIKILSLFQGKILMIDPYTLYAERRYQDVMITFQFLH
jgi:hypothetical protein